MMSREEAIIIFRNKATEKPTRWQKVFMFCYLGVGLVALVLELIHWKKNGEPAALFLMVGIPYMALWILFRLDLFNDRRCARLMLDALNGNDEKLAWIYVEEESGARESFILHYRFTDRHHGEIFGSYQMVTDLFAFLASHFTNISTGYTNEIDKIYRRNPEALKTLPKRSNARLQTIVDSDNASNGW